MEAAVADTCYVGRITARQVLVHSHQLYDPQSGLHALQVLAFARVDTNKFSLVHKRRDLND